MKTELANKLFLSLPPELRMKFATQFGDFGTFGSASTEEEANVLAANIMSDIHKCFFRPLSGIPIVELFLYLGSLNPTHIAGLFSGLESLRGGVFEVLAPQQGEVYPGFFDDWTVWADNNVESLTVTLAGEQEDSFSLSKSGSTWGAKFPVQIGEHTAIFSDGTHEKSVSFSVVGWEFYPPEGSQIPSGETDVSVDFGDVTPESFNITLTNQDTGEKLETARDVTKLILNVGNWLFNVTVLLPASVGTSVQNLTHIHEFLVTPSGEA